MQHSTFDLETPVGKCSTEIIQPDGSGPWPAVILCVDGAGPRRAMTEIGERIAKLGYLVAIPNLFFRAGDVREVVAPEYRTDDAYTFDRFAVVFSKPELRSAWFQKFYSSALAEPTIVQGIGALLDHLDGRDDVIGKVGTTGYCLGGNASLRIASAHGDRIAATASFHAGGLVTDAPDSPHRHLASVKSRVYVAGASDDSSFTDDNEKVLEAALTEAGIGHTVLKYPGGHGFAVHDHSGVYDPACAKRHDEALEELFASTLRA